MNKSVVPKLSSNDIELKAEQVIEFFEKSVLHGARPTPLLDFARSIKQKYGVDFRTDLDLGGEGPSKKLLGLYRPKPRAIFIDRSLEGTNRQPFVLAHELGHYVLHRDLDPKKSGYTDSVIGDTEFDMMTLKKILSTPRDWIEWQANRFASAILMPRATFSDALISYHRDAGIKRNVGIVVVNKTLPSIADFQMTLARLADKFGVNKTNVEYRLNDLDLLQDLRGTKSSHIAQFFKEEKERTRAK
jgi:Zn-dependent peptidase ImmA (M78 family)